MEILAVRHTKVDLPEGTCYGCSDVALAPDFEEQFKKIKNQLTNYHFEQIYTSPLSRSLLLAKYLSPQVIPDNRLIEMNFGDWELKSWDNISDPYLNKWYLDFYNLPCPNGESMLQLMKRTSLFLESIKNCSTPTIIISHSGVIRCLHHLINSIPISELFNISVAFGSVTIFNI